MAVLIEPATPAKDGARLSMIENLPVGVVIYSADSRVVLCNPTTANKELWRNVHGRRNHLERIYPLRG